MMPSLFFFNDPATTEIYTLSLHDALPILIRRDDAVQRRLDHFLGSRGNDVEREVVPVHFAEQAREQAQVLLQTNTLADRKSTRLNSSHSQISYVVFCLKKTIYSWKALNLR